MGKYLVNFLGSKAHVIETAELSVNIHVCSYVIQINILYVERLASTGQISLPHRNEFL